MIVIYMKLRLSSRCKVLVSFNSIDLVLPAALVSSFHCSSRRITVNAAPETYIIVLGGLTSFAVLPQTTKVCAHTASCCILPVLHECLSPAMTQRLQIATLSAMLAEAQYIRCVFITMYHLICYRSTLKNRYCE
jgi:hypothetical protein